MSSISDSTSSSIDKSIAIGKDVWKALSSISESSISSLETIKDTSMKSTESTATSVKWTVENRGGFAKVVGFAMVPSQFIGLSYKDSEEIIKQAIMNCSSNRNLPKIERITIGETQGVIVYPANYSSTIKQRCVVYNNPNGVTIAQFMQSGRIDPSYPPAQIMNLRNCPIIMYDYAGTGLSEPGISSLQRFHPTHNSIVENGVYALKYALDNFQEVEMWGSSLGGGVATAATYYYLNRSPSETNRVRVTNHDSFTTTGRVVLPWWISDVISPIFGDLDAQTPMKKLIERNVKIIVLCHTKDFVIKEGARMVEFKGLYNKPNVDVIFSNKAGHANLSNDMLEKLQALQNGLKIADAQYKNEAQLSPQELSRIRNFLNDNNA